MPKSVIKVPNSAMNKFSDWFKEKKIIGGVQLYNTSHTPPPCIDGPSRDHRLQLFKRDFDSIIILIHVKQSERANRLGQLKKDSSIETWNKTFLQIYNQENKLGNCSSLSMVTGAIFTRRQCNKPSSQTNIQENNKKKQNYFRRKKLQPSLNLKIGQKMTKIRHYPYCSRFLDSCY